MKTKLFLPALLLMTVNILIAQNFAPIDATWHYKDFRFDFSPNYFIKVKAENDTVINGKYVTILEVYNNENYIPEGRLFIHEDNNQVFFYEQNEFKLLYDFNLEDGDTMISNIPTNRTHFDFSCYNIDFSDQSETLQTRAVIDSITIVQIDGQDLKVLHTRTITDGDSLNCMNYDKIMEKIGSLKGLCGEHCNQCLAGSPGYLRCYSENGFFYKPTEEDCEFGLNSVSSVEKYQVNMFPNPTNNEIFIESDNLFKYFKVLDLNGRTRIEGEFDNYNINLENLQNGIYMVILTNQKREIIYSKKILKL